MKKRIISLCLALAMCLALLPTVVLADETFTDLTLDKFVSWDGSGDAPATPFKNGGFYVLPDGNYKLAENITVDSRIQIGYAVSSGYKSAKVTLDLNGYVLENTQSNGTTLFIINGSELTLMDSSSTRSGSVRAQGQAIFIRARSKLYANGGSVYGTVAMDSYEKEIVCTGKNPTTFYGQVNGNKSATISGGIFYGGISESITLSGEHITVSFDTNGGSAVASQIFFVTSATPKEPVNPTRTGYTFGGWYEKEDGVFKTDAFDFGTAITSDITLYAKWIPDKYTVTYEPGNEADEGQTAKTDTKVHDTALTLKGETFTREGYKQIKWKTADGTEYALGASYTENAAVTLYPVWTPKTSEVTPVAAAYKVEHYLQKDNGDYEWKETEMFCDLLGKPVTATPKEYDGYHYNAEKSELTASGEITMPTKGADGKPENILTLKLYYDKDASLLPILSMLPGAFESVAGLLDTTFVDVSRGAYYYNAVEWAYNRGIAGGVDSKHFAPDDSCTRAQAVTMLWRAAGCPDIYGENPFVDVDVNDYYYEAVLWAVANGITSGTDEDHFSPDKACTRGQIVTFLHRAARCYVAHDNFGFTDVKIGSYCEDAVNWAVENGITNGTSEGTFSPDDVCTRAQIVTFLYRNK